MGLSLPINRRWFSSPVTDGIIVAFLLSLALVYLDVNYEFGPGYEWQIFPRRSVAVTLLVLAIVPVLFRRRWPLAALVVGAGALIAARILQVPEFQSTAIALFLLLIAAGAGGDDRYRDLVRGGVTVAVILAVGHALYLERALLEVDGITRRIYVLSTVAGVAFNAAYLIAGWAIGDLMRRRTERERELAIANIELQVSREENARQAVLAERVRISREIHDVVAHHVSVMGVQAGAARRVLGTSPDMASEALGDIERSSREAVQELQRLLGFLRSADTNDSVDPLPGLERLPELQRQVAAAGLAVVIVVDGERRDVPPSVDLSAYRIVQEGLTNALKHSGAQEAEVEITYYRDRIAVAVRDRGRGASSGVGHRNGTGNGLRGMRERVALHNGELEYHDRDGGGFELSADLPFRVAATPVAADTKGVTA